MPDQPAAPPPDFAAEPQALTAAYPTEPHVERGARRILVVDDKKPIRLGFAQHLRSCGYDVDTAESGDDALRQIQRTRFSLVLTDVRMPGMSGVDLVPKARALDPDLAVVMLSGVNDAPTAAAAMSHGAIDYLMKPVPLSDLEAALARALHRRDLAVERRRVEQLIREEVVSAGDALERQKASLSALTVSVAEMLITVMEVKDVYLRGHSQRVASLAAEIAEELGLDPDTVEAIRLAGRLHDVGKIGIREAVLNKPGPLTPEEYEHVQDHVRIGTEILGPLKHLGVVLRYVHDHHERWDGRGYPRGLQGAEISIGGRVLTAADAFDALTSRRAYREPMAPVETVEYLGTRTGLLDPKVYEALRAVVTRGQSVSLSFIHEIHG